MMKTVFDYHLHTDNSPDCHADIETQCASAYEKGLTEICVTDHVDLKHPYAEFAPNPARLVADIARARAAFPALSIKTGLELADWEPVREQTMAFGERFQLDFVLLSRHLVDGVDPYGAEKYFGRYESRNAAYGAYADAVLSSVTGWAEFSSLAHLGYVIKKAPYTGDERAFRHADAPDIIDEILTRVVSAGAALEINTSGYEITPYPIPTPCIIRRFAALGGEAVTFGSDAHKPADIARHFSKARALALECGVKYFASFTLKKPEYHPL